MSYHLSKREIYAFLQKDFERKTGVSKNLEIEITILNWEKYNPRKDVKHTSWFRMEHDIFEKPELFDFTHAEVCAWIYLLSIASKRNACTQVLYMAHAMHRLKVSQETMLGALEKLNEIKAITFKHVTHASRTRNASVTHASRIRALRDETRRNETVRETNTDVPVEPERPSFDFEKLYSEYPKRENSRKGEGIKNLQRKIKTQEQFDQVLLAIRNYANFCKTQNTESKFIQQFKTFTNTFQDWLDPDAHISKIPRQLSLTKTQALHQHNEDLVRRHLEAADDAKSS